MALTEDQSAALQTTIGNLNKSIEVNKEVLDIVRSVGNSGAVDIATHNNNAAAHSSGFNDLLAHNTFALVPDGYSATLYGNALWAFVPRPLINSSGFNGIVFVSEWYVRIIHEPE